jgi:hypothetical protein
LRRFHFFSCIITLALVACSGPAFSPSSTAAATSTLRASSLAGATGTTLYVLNFASDSNVTVYNGKDGSLERTIEAPSGTGFIDISSDSKTHLFASVFPSGGKLHNPGVLNVYGNGGATLVQQLHQNHAFMAPIVDPSEDLFAGCAAKNVCEYEGTKGKRTVRQHVIRKLAVGKISPLEGGRVFLMSDSGRLGVNTGAGVDVYNPGSQSPNWIVQPQTLDGINSAAFDSKGDLYLAVRCVTDSSGEVDEYTAGSKYPTRILNANNGIGCPFQLAFDGSDNLYVSNGGFSNDSVIVYSPDSSQPARVLTQGIQKARSLFMAVDQKGDVFVANGSYYSDPGSVVVYGPSGTTPSATITQGLNNPRELAIGQ